MNRTRRVRLALVGISALLILLCTFQPGHSQFTGRPTGISGGISGRPTNFSGISGISGNISGRPTGFSGISGSPTGISGISGGISGISGGISGMGRPTIPEITYTWSCSRCGKSLGTGPNRPSVSVCPSCNARLIGTDFGPGSGIGSMPIQPPINSGIPPVNTGIPPVNNTPAINSVVTQPQVPVAPFNPGVQTQPEQVPTVTAPPKNSTTTSTASSSSPNDAPPPSKSRLWIYLLGGLALVLLVVAAIVIIYSALPKDEKGNSKSRKNANRRPRNDDLDEDEDEEERIRERRRQRYRNQDED